MEVHKAEKLEWLCQSSAGPITRWEVGLLSTEPRFQANGGGAEMARTYRRENSYEFRLKEGRAFLSGLQERIESQGTMECPKGS